MFCLLACEVNRTVVACVEMSADDGSESLSGSFVLITGGRCRGVRW